MIALLFIGSAIVYMAYHWMSYLPHLRETKSAFWIAIITGAVVSWLWLELAKRTENAEKLFFYGLCWDAVVLAASLAIPLTLFGVKPTPVSIVGVILFVLGVFLVKIGSNT